MSQQTQINTTQTSQDDEIEIDLLEIFYFLRAKIVWLIGAFVIGAIVAGVFTRFCITPKYQATSKLYMVSASSDSIVDLTDLNIGTSLSQDYIELLKVRSIFEDVIKELELEYTVDELREMTSIAAIGDTRLIGVTVTSTDPEESKEIANEIANLAVNYIPKVMATATPNIAETAITPEKKSSPSLAKNTIIGALLLMIVVAGIFVVQFLMDDTFKSAEDVEKVFGVMPLTVIPEGDLTGIDDKAEKQIRQRKKKEKKTKETKADEN